VLLLLPVVPVVDDPLPAGRFVVEPEPVVPDVEPEPAVPDEDEPRLEPGDADGDPVSLRLHAVTPTAITSAKNTARAFVMSHLLATGLPR
jgi:hypothetical protein